MRRGLSAAMLLMARLYTGRVRSIFCCWAGRFRGRLLSISGQHFSGGGNNQSCFTFWYADGNAVGDQADAEQAGAVSSRNPAFLSGNSDNVLSAGQMRPSQPVDIVVCCAVRFWPAFCFQAGEPVGLLCGWCGWRPLDVGKC